MQLIDQMSSNTNNKDIQLAVSLALKNYSIRNNNIENNQSFEQTFSSLLKDEHLSMSSSMSDCQQRTNNDSSSTDSAAQQINLAKSGTFPRILRNMLDDQSHDDAIAWCSSSSDVCAADAHLWRIVNIAKLEKILPDFFNHGKYNSFLRQIYRWGFKRYGRSRDCYYHELFRQDKPELIQEMTCAKQQPNQYQGRGLPVLCSKPNDSIGMLQAGSKRNVFSRVLNSLDGVNEQQRFSRSLYDLQKSPLGNQYAEMLEPYPIQHVPLTKRNRGGSGNYHRDLLSQSMDILQQQQAAQREQQRHAAFVFQRDKFNNNTKNLFQGVDGPFNSHQMNNNQHFVHDLTETRREEVLPRDSTFLERDRIRRRGGFSLGTDKDTFQFDPSYHRKSSQPNSSFYQGINDGLNLHSNVRNPQERRASITKAMLQSSFHGIDSKESMNKKQELFTHATHFSPNASTKKNEVKNSTSGTDFSKSRFFSKCPDYENHRILIRESTPNDVIIARGREASDFAGNVQFQKIVAKYQAEFVSLSPYSRERSLVARRIVDTIRNKSPPGRFLKEDALSGLWYDAGEDEAVKMAMITLRSHSRQTKHQPSSSDHSINHPHKSVSHNQNLANNYNRSWDNIDDSEIAHELLSFANMSSNNTNTDYVEKNASV